MKRALALSATITILLANPGFASASAVVAAAARAAKAPAGGMGAAGASLRIPRVSALSGSLGRGVALSPALARPGLGVAPAAARPSPLAAVAAASANLGSALVHPSAAPASAAAATRPRRHDQAPRARQPGVRAALSGMARELAPARSRGGSAAGKSAVDRVWDRAGYRHEGDSAPQAAASYSGAPRRLAGLLPRDESKGGRWRPFVAVPVVVGAVAAGREALKLAAANQGVAEWWGAVAAFVATLPSWAQTGIEVGGAFAVAAIAPKIIRAGMKLIFSYVQWDELRESYVTGVASAAAWFGATAYAVAAIGGAVSLTLNLGVFAAATALASQDLAKNLAAGFKLYRSGKLLIGRTYSVWDEKGRVDEINPRFTVLDTRANPDAEFDWVLLPNEKLTDKIVSHWDGGGAAKLAGWAALALLPAALIGPLEFALQAAGTALITLLAADIFGRRAARWDRRAKEALDRDAIEEYERLIKRSKLLSWIRNGIYFAGLWAVLGLFGMPATWAAFGMTVFSAAVGFYTKNLASDLVAGLMVAYWRPFGKGSYVKIGKTSGWVEDIDEGFLFLRKDAEGRPLDYIPLDQLMAEKIYIGKKPAPAK